MAFFPTGHLVDSLSRMPLRFCISSIRTTAAAFSALAKGPGRTTTIAWLRSMVPAAQIGNRKANEKRHLISVDMIIRHYFGGCHEAVIVTRSRSNAIWKLLAFSSEIYRY